MKKACEYCEYKAACRFNDFAGSRRRVAECKGPRSEKLLELANSASSETIIMNPKFRKNRRD